MLAQLADDVRARRTSAVDLTRDALRRIEALNPRLNAVIRVRAEALDEARALDAALAAGDGAKREGLPLAGLPFLVKDVEDLADVTTTHGSLLFADAPPAHSDSGTVARLRAAGAIPVGKTNVSEFAFEGVTDNRLFGPTLNPWNPAWSPGGSSGGSAAALAAGMAPIATGTDAGGSVRSPAALCGLLGLKPTNGLIGRVGAPEWLDLVTDGIFGSTVADLELLLSVMAGPQPGDPTAAPSWSPNPLPALPREILAAPRVQPGPPLPAEMQGLLRQALGLLEAELHIPVREIAPDDLFPGLHHPDEDSLLLVEAETVAWLGRSTVTANRERFDRHFAVYVDEALGVTMDAYLAARRRRFDHARRMDLLLGQDRVLATPTLNIVGLRSDGSAPDGAGKTNAMTNTNPANVTGHPAISVPAGIQSNGLPFGLQLIGPRYRDDLLLRLAAAWERVAPWPLVAPGYQPFA